MPSRTPGGGVGREDDDDDEKDDEERILEFLLQMEPPGAATLGVLPIVGPAHIGRVRNHFSLISFYVQNDLKANYKDRCLIKHRNDTASGERRLVVILVMGCGRRAMEYVALF